MGDLTRRAISGVVAAVLLATLVVLAAPDVAGAATPSVTVTPSTGLVDAQSVTVSGTGFGAAAMAIVMMCPPSATDVWTCDRRYWVSSVADESGSFTTTFSVVRFPVPSNSQSTPPTDCAVATCTIGVMQGLLGPVTFAPVSFSNVAPPPPPTIHASPATDLVEDQVVQLTGDGFRADERQVDVAQCPPGTSLRSRCQDVGLGSTDSLGHLSTSVEVLRVIGSGPYTDCAVDTCSLTAYSLAGSSQTPIQLATPTLTVSIDGSATLDSSTGEVVAQVTVSCDRSTPMSLWADIGQPGVQGEYELNRQHCAPDAPLHAFLSSRDLVVHDHPFALGTGDVSVHASPTNFTAPVSPPSASTSATATVQLIDQAQLAAAIQVALQDPANNELRAQVQAAIALRASQDPVFRAEFQALLRGG